MKSGNPNFLLLSGPLQACNGTALPLPLLLQYPIHFGISILFEISERLLLHCSWVCLQRRHLKQRILIWKFFSIPSVLYSNSVSELHSMSPIWTASWPHTNLVFRITAGSLLAKCRHVDSWVKTEVKGVSEAGDGVKRKWDKSLGKGCYGIWPINLMWRAGCLLPVQ